MGWKLVRSALCVPQASGGWRAASLDEVVIALRARSELHAEVPNVRLSRKALTVKLRVAGTTPDDLVAEFVAIKGTQNVVVMSEQDHAVIGDTVHPIFGDSFSVAREWAARHRVLDGGRVTLGLYQEMLCDVDAASVLLDEVDLTSDDAKEWTPALDELTGLRADLYDYQRVGSSFIRGLAKLDVGCLVADEMGLGKTLQVITLLLERRGVGQSLVIAPAALLLNWQRELAAFAPSVDVLVHAGPSRTGVLSGLRGKDVVICSYDTVVADLTFLIDANWDVVVLDEAQFIKNPDSRRAGAVKALPKRVGVAVSGTPVENALVDLWSICEFIVPSLLGSRDRFESVTVDDQRVARTIGRLAAPVTLRREVSEVAADLPPIVETEVSISMTDDLRSTYSSLESNDSSLADLTELRVFCAHADENLASFASMPKVTHVVSMLEEILARSEKTLVFASFQRTLDRLSRTISRTFPHAYVAVVDGRVSGLDRQGVIDDFTAAQGGAVLLMNPRAAGVGLNIVAANHVIHFNPEWNPAVTDQATARAYRRKQMKTVFVHHLFYPGSIEDRALEVAIRKRVLANEVNQGVADADSTINAEDRGGK